MTLWLGFFAIQAVRRSGDCGGGGRDRDSWRMRSNRDRTDQGGEAIGLEGKKSLEGEADKKRGGEGGRGEEKMRRRGLVKGAANHSV